MSVIFPPAILGPEMAAPILWAPGILGIFLLENPHPHKIPPFRGRGFWAFLERGGGSANFVLMGVGIFPKLALPCQESKFHCAPREEAWGRNGWGERHKGQGGGKGRKREARVGDG